MPVVRISFPQVRPPAYRRAIADSLHQALVEAVNVSELDRFQVIAEHTPESLVYDPTYPDVGRNDDVVFVQIAFDGRCPTDRKRALYGRILELLARNVGVRSQDVLISLIEVSRESRSPGNRRAQQV